MTGPIRLLLWALLMSLTGSAAFAQSKVAPSRPRPAPHITGRLIRTDGVRSLILEYDQGAQSGPFIGTLQSACTLPSKSKGLESKQLDLNTIPKGTVMTAYYVNRRRRQLTPLGRSSDNIILAVRFDRLQAGSTLPQGVYIPCVNTTEVPAPK